MLDWFKVNEMKVNESDDKFQYIAFCRKKTLSEALFASGQ